MTILECHNEVLISEDVKCGFFLSCCDDKNSWNVDSKIWRKNAKIWKELVDHINIKIKGKMKSRR
jgi:hypothetical protein